MRRLPLSFTFAELAMRNALSLEIGAPNDYRY